LYTGHLYSGKLDLDLGGMGVSRFARLTYTVDPTDFRLVQSLVS